MLLYAALVLKTDSEDRNLRRVAATLRRHRRAIQRSWRIWHVSNTLLCAFHQISLWGKCKEGVMAGTRHKEGTDDEIYTITCISRKSKGKRQLGKLTDLRQTC